MKKRVENQVSTTKTNRFMELEGLRVIAAVVVVLYHAALMFYPGYFYGVGTPWAPVQNMRFEDNLYQNPLAGLLSGTFAVGIFFVLSGFVLSVGYFKKKDASIVVKLASKRYLRLMLPAAFSVMLAWLLITLGLSSNPEVVALTHSGWLSDLWGNPPNFFAALYQGIIRCFTIGEVYYNPVLWTIRLEFIGSFIVFGTLLLFTVARHRWITYGILLFVFANTWFIGFILGMILADVYINRSNFLARLNHKATYVLLLIGVILGSYPSGPITSPLYSWLSIPGFGPYQQISFFISIGATLVVLSVLALPRISAGLAHPRISGLGRYTYSLYLIHMPVLFTVCAGMFVIAFPVGFNKAAAIAVVTTLVALIPITYMFEKYIDAPSIRFASYCTEVFLGKREFELGSKLHMARRWWVRKVKALKPRRANDPIPDIEVE